jgi:hypothetical protein
VMRDSIAGAVAMLSVAALFPLQGANSQTLAGSHACARCHAAEYASQIHTSMAHAMTPVSNCTILAQHKTLNFRNGIYSYSITRQGDRSLYTVTDGNQTISVALEYAFGLGDAGQTYVFTRGGNLYESRVSFYRALDGLDLTLGARNLLPANLDEAAGRLMHRQEIHECFGCHATKSGDALNPETATPGVTCEHCHGSAAEHVQGFQQGKPVPMQKLSALSTEELSNFCGQCHRTWAQIAANGPHDVNNVRFQPYRLANSQCYDPSDRRIACVACHNPHQEVVRSEGSYDSKCLVCHPGSAAMVASKQGARPCPVSSDRCVSCHMPRFEIPGSHYRFFDHDIRVVKSPAVYPE